MVGFSPDDLTQNRFLDGQLNIWQPRTGYRAGADPVFLAASVPARPDQSVLELGCGAGVAILCLAKRVSRLKLTGVEIQADYAELARKNAAENGVTLDVITADLTDLPAQLRQQCFDHVFANPPYFQRANGTGSANTGRDKALAGDTSLQAWIATATGRLKPGGTLTLIQRTDRLPEIITAIDQRLGSLKVKPLVPRVGQGGDLVILTAKKGGRAAFKLLAPFVLHDGAHHEVDGDSYTIEARAILRDAAALEIR
ncbi:MAG: tRNA1(Val) (adenine(37)-N6)-methyltransferase [Paracoccaceae bacterium]